MLFARGARETCLERPTAMRHARCALSDPSRKESPMHMNARNCVTADLGSRARVVDVIAA
jgi:hypothetical protein